MLRENSLRRCNRKEGLKTKTQRAGEVARLVASPKINGQKRCPASLAGQAEDN
jgi:hypothetical protein